MFHVQGSMISAILFFAAASFSPEPFKSFTSLTESTEEIRDDVCCRAGGSMNQMFFIHGPGAGGCDESFVHQLKRYPGSLAPTTSGALEEGNTDELQLDLSGNLNRAFGLVWIAVADTWGIRSSALLPGENHHRTTRPRAWRYRRSAGPRGNAIFAKIYSR